MVNPRLIRSVLAWEALDSRGTPTVACEVTLTDGAQGRAMAPSGASTGRYEAHELRDGGERYGGRGVRRAVASAGGPLADVIVGLDAADQAGIDAALRAADGTSNLQEHGANAVVALSLATLHAAAAHTGLPLYRYLADQSAPPSSMFEMPLPMVNIISGGAHAGRSLDIQDVLVVPVGANSFTEAIEWAARVRRGTAEVMRERGLPTHLVADEGGLSASLATNVAALDLLMDGIARSGLMAGSQVAVAIDVAATQFYDPSARRYQWALEKRDLSATELIDELTGWLDKYPIVSIEDPLADEDWDSWPIAAARLGGWQLLGDDLIVTDVGRLQGAVSEGLANAVLVKVNQTGTVSGAADVVSFAQRSGVATVLSARSGETEESWLADLAVGWRTGQIKVGSTMRSERMAKWNRLLHIEAELGDRAGFAGRDVVARGIPNR